MTRRSLLIALLVVLGHGCKGNSTATRLEMTMPPDIVEDTVMEFRSEGRVVIVHFQTLAGAYRLDVERDDFVEQLSLLAGSYKSRKPVTLTLQGLLIERVSAA